MDVSGRVVVVTGAASGIGAAIARALAAAGANVVAADRDWDGAAEAVRGDYAHAVGVDVTREGEVARLVRETERRHGPIDLYVSNAGAVFGAGWSPGESGPFADAGAWARSWELNLLSHVHALRHLLPRMLDRGGGYFLITASAAGLLTDFACAPYSVTKHAAVGLAEWLAVTYADRGLKVSCLCPQGVETPLLEASAAAGHAAHLVRDAIAPEAAAASVLAGVAEERFLILPHPEVAEYFARMAADPEAWIAGMSRLRRRLYGGHDG